AADAVRLQVQQPKGRVTAHAVTEHVCPFDLMFIHHLSDGSSQVIHRERGGMHSICSVPGKVDGDDGTVIQQFSQRLQLADIA
ncbi:MAG TPA: hypothetical protein PLI08_01410, partial [Bacteroidia bacterium]|nr:hypothetical protein [Bacteroidia bacterium]